MDSYSSFHTGGSSAAREGDFQRLCQVVGSNIQKISQNVSSMQRMVQQLGTSQDSEDLRAKLHQIQHYTNQLAKDTNTHLKNLSSIATPNSLSEQRQWKMQKERLRNEFSNTLNDFQVAQRAAAAKEKETVQRNLSSAMGGGSKGFHDEDTRGGNTLIQLESPVQSQSTMQFDESNFEMIREREQSIRKLESDIMDVNQIFKDLATMVHEQGEIVESIESALENTQIHVSEGTEQLNTASRLQSQARRKMLIIFVIVTIVLAIVITIIVVSVKK